MKKRIIDDISTESLRELGRSLLVNGDVEHDDKKIRMGETLIEYAWALNFVLMDVKNEQTKNLTNTLPIEYAAPILRIIRRNACFIESVDKFECGAWSPIKADQNIEYEKVLVSKNSSKLLKNKHYVCDTCKHPKLKIDSLIRNIGITKKNGYAISGENFRRLLNFKQRMPIDQFQAAVIFAVIRDYIDVKDVMRDIVESTNILIVQNTMKELVKRGSDRTSYRNAEVKDKTMRVTEDEFFYELEEQVRLHNLKIVEQKEANVFFKNDNKTYKSDVDQEFIASFNSFFLSFQANLDLRKKK